MRPLERSPPAHATPMGGLSACRGLPWQRCWRRPQAAENSAELAAFIIEEM
ncbi:hypothetical protein [Candidatus Reidiella endopervernicosa]|uniref:Uncharacterized protein n=1 Tax=Candidatus Reidiella endopervernicosa TaxID=2738883 RepID=A0A6N0HVB3_9GAMM|nr:hypothetical protein [Candidatus Reidiella endopervernicosa]QKQ26121.1 hypothetical protein HUE57_07370 [Candidatus Reidiella endopervernicosa]